MLEFPWLVFEENSYRHFERINFSHPITCFSRFYKNRGIFIIGTHDEFTKNCTSQRSLPFASILYTLAVLRFFNRSESSLRLSNTSSTPMSNLPAQSALNWLRKSSLVLNVTLSWKIAFRKFRKVLYQCFFLEKPKVELVVSVQDWDKEAENNLYLTHNVLRKYEE